MSHLFFDGETFGFERSLQIGEKGLPCQDEGDLGLARRTGSTYVWVGKDGKRDLGGILHLGTGSGTIYGVSVPTIGVGPLPAGIVAAFPIAGRLGGGNQIRWQTPAPDGSRIVSEVRVRQGGRYLEGRTEIATSRGKRSYRWEAELVAGKPLGV